MAAREAKAAERAAASNSGGGIGGGVVAAVGDAGLFLDDDDDDDSDFELDDDDSDEDEEDEQRKGWLRRFPFCFLSRRLCFISPFGCLALVFPVNCKLCTARSRYPFLPHALWPLLPAQRSFTTEIAFFSL